MSTSAESALHASLPPCSSPLPPLTDPILGEEDAGPSQRPVTPPPAVRAAQATPASAPRSSARIQHRAEARGEHGSPIGSTSRHGAPEPAPVVEEPEYLQPAEFSPLNNHARPPPLSTRHGGPLSPEDDKLALRGIPIFRPTMEEFKDFEGYVTRTVPWGQYSGIVKIVPPAEWTSTLPAIPARSLADVKIRSPIQQNMLGQAGLFRQTNVEKNKNRPLSVKEWFDKCMSAKFTGPGPKDVDVTLDRDSKEAKQLRRDREEEQKRKRDEARGKRAAAAARKAERQRVKDEAPVVDEGVEEKIDLADEGNEAQEEKAMDEQEEEQINGHEMPEDGVPPLDPSTHHSPQSSPDTLAKTPETDPDPVDDWYSHFEPSRAWLPKGTRPEDYTAEACAQMERRFWKNMGLGEPSWYGADLQGTLFPDPETPWNVAHLPNLLNRLGRELPGVNRPYLYFGMWRAAFAWHVEDMDLFSINYIHFGAPKFWYAIPQGQAEQFERTITSYFPLEAAECDQFLRHKAYIMSPTRLAKDGINVNMLVHNQGEFIITYPRGYHAGFNLGFNCAESVNFALDSWLELGRRAKVCQCVSHSVHIDVDELMGEQEKLVEQQDKIQTEQEILDAIHAERAGKPRKRTSAADGERPRKRIKGEPTIAGEEDGQQHEPEPLLPVKGLERKKKVTALNGDHTAKIPSRPMTFPCIFCPGGQEDDLLLVMDPPEAVRAMCKSADGVVRAHQVCANSVPEVSTEDLETDGKLQIVVRGVEDVPKSRWALKCQSCKDKKLAAMGAKVQCVSGKCPRAFHVSCAQADEQIVFRVWEVEEWQPMPLPEDAPPGAQHDFERVKTLKTELLCPTHNPDVKEAKKAQQARELKSKILAILPGQEVKIKNSRGSFMCKMIRIIEGEQVAEVEHENGTTVMVKWTEVDFRPGPAQMQENEYARVHTHTRRTESGTSVPIKATVSDDSLRADASAGSAVKATVQTQSDPKKRKSLSKAAVHAQAGQARPQAHAVNGQTSHRVHPALQSQAHPASAPHHSQPNGYASHRMGVKQILNGSPGPSIPPAHDARHIPSRVVVCDSDYRHPSAYPSYPIHHPSMAQGPPPLQYAYQGPGVPNGHHQVTYPPSHHAYPPVNPSQAYPQGYPRHAYPAPAWAYAAPHPSGPHVLPPPPHQHPAHPYPAPYPQPAHSPSPVGPPGPQFASAPLSRASASHSPQIPSVSTIRRQSDASTRNAKIELGLERMISLMRALPALNTPAIHLAGTNGKGSVSAILGSCLLRAGLSVARYNSPHLVEPRDAIALNGTPPSAEEYNRAMYEVQQISHKFHLDATPFELATAAAYAIITSFQPDIMIIECGMGGEGDATNVIPPQLVLATALTSVGLDHTAFLGDNIEDITRVKSAIAVQDGLMVVAPQPYPQVVPVAQRTGSCKGSKVLTTERAVRMRSVRTVLDLDNFADPPSTAIRVNTRSMQIETSLALAGEHQLDNVSLAVNLLCAIKDDRRALSIQPKLAGLSADIIAHGVATAQWAGRCSFLKARAASGHLMPVLVDGAHNTDSAATLRSYIDSLDIRPASRGITWILGLSNSPGKTPQSVIEPLVRKGDRVIATSFSDVEGMPWVKPVNPHVVRDIAVGLTRREETCMVVRDAREALEVVAQMSPEDRGLVVCAGSLYLVADVYRVLGRAA